MKIIKRGKKKKKHPKRFKCCFCGCVFELDDQEYIERVKIVSSYRYSNCPECGGQANEVER